MKKVFYQSLLIEPNGTQEWWLHFPERRGAGWTVRPYGGGFGDLPSLKVARRGVTTKLAQDYLELGWRWEIRTCSFETVDNGPRSPLQLLAEQAE